MRFPVQNLSWDQIKGLARPQNPAQPEAIPAVLFDTLTYTDNATTSLRFYQQTSNDVTVSNVQNGRLPQDNAFRIAAFGCDILRAPTVGTGTGAGAIDDMAKLLKSGRPVFQFKTAQKDYGQIPLTFAHASGGETGFLSLAGTAGAVADNQYANNGVFDGGFYTDNNLWIIPNTAFEVNVTWAAAQNLTADVSIRFWMAGTLYRPVL
jgi:hypothetical protein